MLAILGLFGCSANSTDAPEPTIAPAEAAVSPPVTGEPPGVVLPLSGQAQAALFDARTRSLVALSPGPAGQSVITALTATGAARPVPLPAVATAMTGDDDGRLYVSTRGGYFRVDLAAGAATRVDVEGHQATDFTAIARRADGKLVLGSADGAVYTLSSDTAVGASVKMFTRVDALVTQGNTAVVLDRGQTSVTTVSESGTDSATRASGRRRGDHHRCRSRSAGCWWPTPAATDCWCSASTP